MDSSIIAVIVILSIFGAVTSYRWLKVLRVYLNERKVRRDSWAELRKHQGPDYSDEPPTMPKGWRADG